MRTELFLTSVEFADLFTPIPAKSWGIGSRLGKDKKERTPATYPRRHILRPFHTEEDIPLDAGRPCAYFSKGRQILEKARVVHPGARSFAEALKLNELN
jgi:hypothetical protein